jgi:polyisoprenoid-binding protein YceI
MRIRFFAILPILAIAAFLATAAGPAEAKPEKYVIDPAHFTIALKVRHIGYYDMVGLFTEGAGSFTFDEKSPAVSDIRIVVKTGTFFSGHEKRDDHVRSADFLNAKEFPEMVFVGKRAEKTGDRTGKIHGDLTLRGVTKPLTLDITWNKSGEYLFGGGLLGGKTLCRGVQCERKVEAQRLRHDLCHR